MVLAPDLFFEGVPREVLDEKLYDLGIDGRAFERDMARSAGSPRSPSDGPSGAIPEAVEVGRGAARASGVGPRVRAWINKEDPLA